MKIIANRPCRHYDQNGVGDPFYAQRCRNGGKDRLDNGSEQAL